MDAKKAQDNSPTPWWKQVWPWLLISGPAVAAMGCAVTIWLAYQVPDQSIREGVVKQGLKTTETGKP